MNAESLFVALAMVTCCVWIEHSDGGGDGGGGFNFFSSFFLHIGLVGS